MSAQEFLLTTLRDFETPPPLFRKTTSALAAHFAKEARALHPTLLIPILRSGLALLPAFTEAFPEASIGILGIKRDEITARPHLYYEKLPRIGPEDRIALLDPMLATGGTARLAFAHLAQKGATEKNIALIGVLSSAPGEASVKDAYPEATLRILATDPLLSPHKMIVPGLGDFGDRFFGTI